MFERSLMPFALTSFRAFSGQRKGLREAPWGLTASSLALSFHLRVDYPDSNLIFVAKISFCTQRQWRKTSSCKFEIWSYKFPRDDLQSVSACRNSLAQSARRTNLPPGRGGGLRGRGNDDERDELYNCCCCYHLVFHAILHYPVMLHVIIWLLLIFVRALIINDNNVGKDNNDNNYRNSYSDKNNIENSSSSFIIVIKQQRAERRKPRFLLQATSYAKNCLRQASLSGDSVMHRLLRPAGQLGNMVRRSSSAIQCWLSWNRFYG